EALSVDQLTILARLKPYARIHGTKERKTVTALLRQGNNDSARSRNLLTAMEGQVRSQLAAKQRHLVAVRLLSFRVALIGLPLGAIAGLLLVLVFVARLV